MTNPRPDTSGLARAAQERKERTYNAVSKTLKTMVREGCDITFAELARRSGVSARYIQTHPQLGPKVRSLSQAPKERPLTSAPDHGDDSVVAALRHHIRQLEQQHTHEVAALRAELKQAHDTIARLTARLVQHDHNGRNP